MSYFGRRFASTPSFDPSTLVQINAGTSLTNVSVGRTYFLNSPANYTVTLPQLSTCKIGDTLTFVHSASSGAATIATYAGDYTNVFGSNSTTITMNPGDILELEYASGIWNIVLTNKEWTPPQGTNDNTPASAAFVINEFGKHKNYIINGNFDFWQRGTTSSTTGAFVADRWQTTSIGSTFVVSRQSFTLGQGVVPNEPAYFHRTAVTSVAGSGNYASNNYKIESARITAGKTLTISFWAKADGNKNISMEIVQNYGTGGSASAALNGLALTSFALTTSWTKYTATFVMPTLAGKTLGTNNNDCINIIFWLDAGSSLASRSNGLGQQSIIFDLAQVQLEEGSVATQFEQRHLAVELAMCQRYYEKSFELNTAPGTAGTLGAGCSITGSTVAGSATTTGLITADVKYRVEKRALPTIQLYDHTCVAGYVSRFNLNVLNNAGATYTLNANGTTGFTINSISGAAANCLAYFWTADAEL